MSDPAAPPPIQRLGVLSDSHGRVASCRRAMSALRDLQVDAIVHLGDVGTPAVLEELVGDPPVHVVFGNCDDERDLATHARCMGLTVHHPLGRLEVAGRGVAFTHGHLREAFEATLGREPMLLTGHTHRVAADRLQVQRRASHCTSLVEVLDVFGVPVKRTGGEASAAELRRAYLKAAMRFHPDRSLGASLRERRKNEEIFKVIQQFSTSTGGERG